jgi:hypothetical protein
MKRRVLPLLLLALTALAVPTHADVFLLGFTGYDYESPDSVDPDPDGVNYLNVGDGYKMVGFVTQFGPMLQPYVDPTQNEYTVYLFDLVVKTHTWDAPNQYLSVAFNDNGRARYFQDGKPGCGSCTPGTPAVYGTNPPNGTVPSTFTDGVLKLGGSVDKFVLTYDYDAPPSQPTHGAYNGEMTQDEGSDLGYIPADQRHGWTLAGLLGRRTPPVPDGYDHQVTGECRIEDPTTGIQKTWGALKALYR